MQYRFLRQTRIVSSISGYRQRFHQKNGCLNHAIINLNGGFLVSVCPLKFSHARHNSVLHNYYMTFNNNRNRCLESHHVLQSTSIGELYGLSQRGTKQGSPNSPCCCISPSCDAIFDLPKIVPVIKSVTWSASAHTQI